MSKRITDRSSDRNNFVYCTCGGVVTLSGYHKCLGEKQKSWSEIKESQCEMR